MREREREREIKEYKARVERWLRLKQNGSTGERRCQKHLRKHQRDKTGTACRCAFLQTPPAERGKGPYLASEHMLYIHRSPGREEEDNTPCTGCIHIEIQTRWELRAERVKKGEVEKEENSWEGKGDEEEGTERGRKLRCEKQEKGTGETIWGTETKEMSADSPNHIWIETHGVIPKNTCPIMAYHDDIHYCLTIGQPPSSVCVGFWHLSVDHCFSEMTTSCSAVS